MKQLIIGCALLFSINMMAQTKVNNDLMTWWNMSFNYSLSEKTSISSLYSFRRADFVENWQQSLFRIGLNYKVAKSITLTSGYDWAITFPYGKQPIAKKTPEHRIFEQITLNQSAWKLNIKHRYRFEQRFFNNSIHTKHRFRYRLGVSVPISKNEKLHMQFFDEVFLNYGKETHNHIFDQNWAYGGLAYDVTKNVKLKLGYMNQYILKVDNIKTENNSTLQFGIALKK